MHVPRFLWAAIAESRPDEENGLVGYYDPDARQWIPVVCFYERNLPFIEKLAKKVANDSGRKIRVYKFMHVEDE